MINLKKLFRKKRFFDDSAYTSDLSRLLTAIKELEEISGDIRFMSYMGSLHFSNWGWKEMEKFAIPQAGDMAKDLNEAIEPVKEKWLAILRLEYLKELERLKKHGRKKDDSK